MITTIVKCRPGKPGHIRTWDITQSVSGEPPRTVTILARTGCDALAIAPQALGLDLKRPVFARKVA